MHRGHPYNAGHAVGALARDSIWKILSPCFHRETIGPTSVSNKFAEGCAECHASALHAQALWTALETELGQLAAEHAGEVQRLYDRCEAALRAAKAAAAARERSPGDGCGVQHNPLFDHVDGRRSEDGCRSDAGLSSDDGDREEEVGATADGEAASGDLQLRHAAELASVRAGGEARLAAAQEEIELKSARLAELEVTDSQLAIPVAESSAMGGRSTCCCIRLSTLFLTSDVCSLQTHH